MRCIWPPRTGCISSRQSSDYVHLSGGKATSITEAFLDQGERNYGLWEYSYFGTARGPDGEGRLRLHVGYDGELAGRRQPGHQGRPRSALTGLWASALWWTTQGIASAS